MSGSPSRCANQRSCSRSSSRSSGSARSCGRTIRWRPTRPSPCPRCLGFPMILATPDLSINNLLEPLLSQGPAFLSPVITSGSIELMQELVTRGHGIAFQTNVGLDRRLADRSLVFIPIDAKGPLWSDLGIYTRAGPPAPDRDRQLRAGAQGGNPPTPAGRERKPRLIGSRRRVDDAAAVSAAGCATFAAIPPHRLVKSSVAEIEAGIECRDFPCGPRLDAAQPPQHRHVPSRNLGGNAKGSPSVSTRLQVASRHPVLPVLWSTSIDAHRR